MSVKAAACRQGSALVRRGQSAGVEEKRLSGIVPTVTVEQRSLPMETRSPDVASAGLEKRGDTKRSMAVGRAWRSGSRRPSRNCSAG